MSGIHHVTAISGAAERNLDFYTRVLGLRLVKKTVNFDDPGTYHLYYGDTQGQPGTILTFFPWAHAAQGRLGVGETQETAFRVPAAAIGSWTHRLVEKGVPHALEKRFGETVLTFTDPDGMRFALVGVAGAENEPAWGRDIPAEHAIRGFHGVTLLSPRPIRPPRSCRCSASARSRTRERCGVIAPTHRSAVTSICARPATSCAAGKGAARCITWRSAPRMMRRKPQWWKSSPRRACRSPSRRIATTSARSISASRAGCCSRSRPTIRASRWTSRPKRSARALKLPRFLEPRRAELEAKLPPLGEPVA